MKQSSTLAWLVLWVGLLAFIATSAGLFWPAEGEPFTFTTLHGQTVQMYGQGLYRNDSLLIGSGFRGQDAVTLLLGLPLLGVALLLTRRGSLRGGLLLMGILAYFLYYGVSMALGAAYNPLFLVYVALFSVGLFAFVTAFTSIDPATLAANISPRLPHRGIAVFLFFVGLVLIVVWFGLSLLPAMLQGKAPAELASYTTLITHVLDLGIMMPVSILAGVLILRRAPLGYLLASTMLIFSWLIGVTIAASTTAQWLAGYPYTVGQIVGMVTPFIILALVGLWLTVILFRHIDEPYHPNLGSGGREATRIIASTFGVIAGLVGLEHGIGEILQGNVAPSGIVIESWPESALFSLLGGEPAMTIIPNLFVTGVLASVISVIQLVWAAAFVGRKNGGLVLILLSILQLLVGGGFGPPLVGTIAGLVGVQIHKPLRWWQAHLSANALYTVAGWWQGSFVVSLMAWLLLFPGTLIIGYFFPLIDPNVIYALILLAFGSLLATILIGFVHDSSLQRYSGGLP